MSFEALRIDSIISASTGAFMFLELAEGAIIGALAEGLLMILPLASGVMSMLNRGLFDVLPGRTIDMLAGTTIGAVTGISVDTLTGVMVRM